MDDVANEPFFAVHPLLDDGPREEALLIRHDRRREIEPVFRADASEKPFTRDLKLTSTAAVFPLVINREQ